MNENVLLDAMDLQINRPLEGRLITFSKVSNLIVILIGGLALCGWIFGIQPLKSVWPGLATMKANTAISFMIAGVGLWFGNTKKTEPIQVRILQVCAGLVLLLGLLTLGEYTFRLDFGIDQLIFKDLQTSASSFPGRMSITTAINFTLLGMALLVIDTETRQKIRPAQFLALIAGAIAFIALIGYLYGVESLYSVGLYSSMALHSALGFAVLSIGILCARPRRGLMEIVLTETIGGVILRRLLPMAIVIPVVIGWFRLQGQRMGLYDTNFGLALMVMLSAAFLIVVIWLNADSLNRVDMERKKTVRALRGSEERFHLAVEASPSAMIAVDREGKINQVNEQARELFGYREEELLGYPIEMLVPERFRSGHTSYRQNFLAQPTRRSMGVGRDLFGLRKDGHEVPIEIGLTPYESSDGLFTLALIVDITERKRAEEDIYRLNEELEQRVAERTIALSQANGLLQMLLDQMPDQIYFKDAQSRFIKNSRSQARALGLSDPADAIGKSDFDFFPHAQQSFEIEQEIIRSGKPLVDQEEHVVWPDGQETWVSTTKAPLRDPVGQIIGTFGISRDITERKRAEAAEQKARLELGAANKELEAFAYSVSHDLRAPLRTIDGFSQALLEDYGDTLPDEGRDHLTRVRKAAQHMAQLIDDLLNLSRITRAVFNSAAVDLSKLAENITAELQRTHPERDVRLSIAPDLKVRGDSNLLHIVLENLLNNAWKFTTKQEQAEIEFGSKYEGDERIYFVRDNGAGFDMTYVNKLFGAFQRLHAMTEFPGTGVGLATVQRIINRHGGRIWAEAEVDHGATFFFTLTAVEHAKSEVVPEEKESLAKRIKEII